MTQERSISLYSLRYCDGSPVDRLSGSIAPRHAKRQQLHQRQRQQLASAMACKTSSFTRGQHLWALMGLRAWQGGDTCRCTTSPGSAAQGQASKQQHRWHGNAFSTVANAAACLPAVTRCNTSMPTGLPAGSQQPLTWVARIPSLGLCHRLHTRGCQSGRRLPGHVRQAGEPRELPQELLVQQQLQRRGSSMRTPVPGSAAWWRRQGSLLRTLTRRHGHTPPPAQAAAESRAVHSSSTCTFRVQRRVGGAGRTEGSSSSSGSRPGAH